MAKKNLFTTPKGVAQYPWLNTADFAYDSNGQFKCNLRMQVADAKELMDQIKAVANDEFGNKATNARMPFKIDEETGEVIFTTKSRFQPKFADSTGALIVEGKYPQIYGGSVLKLAGNLYPYNAAGGVGISMQLAGVQVVSLAPPKSIQFGAEEGGFVAANDNEPEGEEDEASYNF